MTCDCRETIESKLLARFKEQVPDAQNHEASLNRAIQMQIAREKHNNIKEAK